MAPVKANFWDVTHWFTVEVHRIWEETAGSFIRVGKYVADVGINGSG